MKTHTILGLVVSLCLPPILSHAQEPDRQALYVEEFGTDQPRGWDLGSPPSSGQGGWRVYDGKLMGSGTIGEKTRFAVYDACRWQDLRVRFRVLLGNEESTVHLICQLSDAGRYFVGFQANRAYLTEESPWSTFHELDANSVRHEPRTWHAVDIVVQEPHIRVFVNGRQELYYSEAKLLPPGKLAVEIPAQAAASVLVDRVTVIGRPEFAADSASEEGPVSIAIVHVDETGKETGMSHRLTNGLQHASEIATSARTRAFVGYKDLSEIILKPKTHIVIDSPGIFGKLGDLFLSIKGIFSVKVKSATFGVGGTDFNVQVHQEGSVIEVIQGEVMLTPSEESQWTDSVSLGAGQWATVGAADQPERLPLSDTRFTAIVQSAEKLREQRRRVIDRRTRALKGG